MEEHLREQEQIVCSTSGVSMWPMLRNRKDMIVVSAVQGDLKKRDVPLYRTPSGKLILHRILAVKDDHYVIRGDNLLDKEHVPKKWVIGVLKAFYRNGKYYDCETNRIYHAYIRINQITFPIRYLWKRMIRPVLAKIKHVIMPHHTP